MIDSGHSETKVPPDIEPGGLSEVPCRPVELPGGALHRSLILAVTAAPTP